MAFPKRAQYGPILWVDCVRKSTSGCKGLIVKHELIILCTKTSVGFRTKGIFPRVTVHKAHRERMDITHKHAEVRTTNSTQS